MISLPTLNGKTLPSFPCTNDIRKKPLSTHGFKDATTDPEKFIKIGHLKENSDFLFGIPTGTIVGFDVLDIDPDGFEWWQNQTDVPLTRTHTTRRGGWHLLFQHLPNLKNSASKIADGIDIRADGGYMIWWPSHGLSVSNHEIISPWPNWLLTLLTTRTPKKETRLHGHLLPDPNKNFTFSLNKCIELLAFDEEEKEIIDEIYLRLLEHARSEVTMIGGSCVVRRYSRESVFAIYAAARARLRVGSAKVGTRNSTLNAEAYALGRIMARAWTPPKNIIRALWRGALTSRLVVEDGIESVIQTIISGLSAGLKKPYPNLSLQEFGAKK